MMPQKPSGQMSLPPMDNDLISPKLEIEEQFEDVNDRPVFHQDFLCHFEESMMQDALHKREDVSQSKQIEAMMVEEPFQFCLSMDLKKENERSCWSECERRHSARESDSRDHDPNPDAVLHEGRGCEVHEGDISANGTFEASGEQNAGVFTLSSTAAQHKDVEVPIPLDRENDNGSNDDDDHALFQLNHMDAPQKDISNIASFHDPLSWLKVDEEICLKVNDRRSCHPFLLFPSYSCEGESERGHSTHTNHMISESSDGTPVGKSSTSPRNSFRRPDNGEKQTMRDELLSSSSPLKILKSRHPGTDCVTGSHPDDSLDSGDIVISTSSSDVCNQCDSDCHNSHLLRQPSKALQCGLVGKLDSNVSMPDSGTTVDCQYPVVQHTLGNYRALSLNSDRDESLWLEIDEEVSLKFHPSLSSLYNVPQSNQQSRQIDNDAKDVVEDSEATASVPEGILMDAMNFDEVMQHQRTPTKGQGGRGRGPGQGQNRQGQGQNRQRQSSNQKAFETYWSEEAVSQGIKRGQLIVGPIRINPKNYREAYVPQTDGLADVFINDLEDRNRALNSDEVVVLPFALEKWRVNVEEYEEYRDSARKGARSNHAPRGKEEEESKAGEDGKGESDSDDSGPDVVIESDEEANAKLQRASGSSCKGTKSANGPALKQLEGAIKSLTIASDSSKGRKSSDDSKSPKTLTLAQMREKFGHEPLAAKLFGQDLEKLVTPVSVGTSLAARFLQVTGRVVFIYERKHSRAASGHIRLMGDKSRNLALFAPFDSRVPRIIIPMADCPKDFYDRPEDYSSTLFIARITSWEENSKMPKGNLARSIGEAGQVEPETEAMLIEMDVDDSPFSDDVIACLPQDLPWTIPEQEIASRKDLRSSCIFTIDPSTARDLDDAVSCQELGNGQYKVGVHIADVSYFVTEGTELDKVASQRATSVYLVQKVVPMLPRLLCEELCSLNPDEDRLAFSVEWILNEEGEILEEWYGRTVIRSCVKLSYEHAQGFIDQPEREWTAEELPPISAPFSTKDIVKRVLLLNKIAVALRKQRFDNGALRLDQVKLSYTLDKETGLPNGTFVYQQKDSNRLIEEFMLLANMAVAHRIKNCFPQLAILRRHPSPQVRPLQALEDLCEGLGLELNTATAGTVQESLRKYYAEDEYSLARVQVLVTLISKPMQNARYFCTGCLPDEAMYHHYALNVPLYTHFTSPIRRYADVMVHRLLAASQGYSAPPSVAVPELQKRASHCNDKKLNAKMASDRSSDMFFALYIKEAGQMEAGGMVMAVLDKSFDVLILSLGVNKRVYLENLPLMGSSFTKVHKSPELTIEWAADEKCGHRTHHRITLFTMVDCVLYAAKEPLRWTCVIRRPKTEIKYMTGEDS